MRKFFAVVFLALILMIPTVAFADGGVVENSPEFFTWAVLATYAGSVVATTMIVQLTKGIGFIDRIPTRIYSYIVAVIILILATIFTGAFTLSQGVLCLINAAVVSLASNGAFDAIAKRE